MKRIYGVAFCGAAIFTVAGSNAAQTASASAPAASSAGDTFHIEINGTDGAQFTKIYRSANGKLIDASTFAKAMQGGGSFTPAIDPVKKVITLTLKSATSTDNGLAIHVGQPFPDFHLPTVDDKGASAGKLAGKPTLVDFFFADCVGCIEELPALNAYAKKHPEVNFLAVTFDDAKVAKDFVRQRHFEWPVAYDGKPLITKLGVTNFPTMLLLDAHGNLLASHSGSIPAESIHRGHGPVTQPSDAQFTQSQLDWLDRWVAKAVVHND